MGSKFNFAATVKSTSPFGLEVQLRSNREKYPRVWARSSTSGRGRPGPIVNKIRGNLVETVNEQTATCATCDAEIVRLDGAWYHARIEDGSHEPSPREPINPRNH